MRAWRTLQPASSEAATAAVAAVVDLFSTGTIDAVIDFLPDEVLDRAIAMKRAKLEEGEAAAASAADAGLPARPPRPAPAADSITGQISCNFSDLVDGARPEDLTLDAYAMRTLVLAAPLAAAPRSGLRLGPERYVERVGVTAASGEEAVLRFEMALQEAVVSQYKGIAITKRWFLRAITGARGPGLAALQRRDAAGVFAFASPANQSATGPLPRFTWMLQQPPYGALLGHVASEVLRCVQMQRDKALVIVGVTTARPGGGGSGGVMPWGEALATPPPQQAPLHKAVFIWELGLQPGSDSHDIRNCWLTEGVRPISGEAGLPFRF
eukprot:scaffold9.g3188.t1